MRITTNLIYSNIYNSTNNELSALQDVQERSTIKLLSAADDPSGYQLVSRMESTIGGIDAYTHNMTNASAYHQDIDTTISQVLSLVSEVDTAIAKASNGTWNADDLALMANDINYVLEQMIDTVNSESSLGEYAFSGTKGDTAPYSATRDANGKIVSVTYEGNDQEKNIKISSSQTTKATENGENVFGPDGSDIFTALIDLRDDLQSGTFDSVSGEAYSSIIDDHRQNMIFSRSQAGVEANKIERLSQFNESMKKNYNEILVQTKDADFTQVATDIMKHQTALQLSSQLGKVLSNMAFVDFT